MWGDYDNDGWTDLIGGESPLIVLRNSGSNTFSAVNFSFTSALPQNSVWLDADGDGRLDIISMRRTGTSAASAYAPVWYRNNDTNLNPAPETPGGLEAQVQGDRVVLSWARTVDANQAGGHTYNVVVGSRSGAQDVVSPHAQLETGRLLLNESGNSGIRTNFLVENLRPGTYFWRVQAIDHSYAASPFSREATFTIAPASVLTLSISGLEGDSIVLRLSGVEARDP
jgi:hypothetical protein